MARKRRTLPLIPLRGITIFPFMVLHFDVGREKSIVSLDEAMLKNQEIFLVPQKDSKIENPTKDDLMSIVLESGGDDLLSEADQFEITCSPESFESLLNALEAAGVKWESAEISMVPDTETPYADARPVDERKISTSRMTAIIRIQLTPGM